MLTGEVAPPSGQFAKGALVQEDLDPSPFTQFHAWFAAATEAGVPSPETTVLSTACLPSGRVSARTVYLKELAPSGFILYSNFATSCKAADLRSNPWAALTFHWRELEQQVRVEGLSERLSEAESQRYFDMRLRGSRLGAWASAQSTVLRDRAELEARVADVEQRFAGVDEIPVPPFWGGLRIRPMLVEFWQGRPSRLHDRFVYKRAAVDGDRWTIERLSP